MHRPPEGLPRLLGTGDAAVTGARAELAAHLRRHGPPPFRAGRPGLGRAGSPPGSGLLVDSVERAGLTGRGGAGFPTARKMRAVLDSSRAQTGRRRRPVVVANGAESEPLSAKDRSLLTASPHLVLDGISLAAECVGADEAYLCVEGSDEGLHRRIAGAIAARKQAATDPVGPQIVPVPSGYVTSEESALVHLLNGGPAAPTLVPPRPFAKGVRGRPTLVSNVETLAHVALIARYGPGWFRSVGHEESPGSALLTVCGTVRTPGVLEVALGTSVREVIAGAGGAAQPPQAILTGGYFGAWIPAAAGLDTRVSGPGLRAGGGSLGAGVLAVLPESACGIAETARIAHYLAGQTAGQCGPCVNGLPAIAGALADIAWGGGGARSHQWLTRLFGLVEGRGACHFPNGAVRLVASALRVFSADLRRHLRHGPCEAARRPPVLCGPGLDAGVRRASRSGERAAVST